MAGWDGGQSAGTNARELGCIATGRRAKGMRSLTKQALGTPQLGWESGLKQLSCAGIQGHKIQQCSERS